MCYYVLQHFDVCAIFAIESLKKRNSAQFSFFILSVSRVASTKRLKTFLNKKSEKKRRNIFTFTDNNVST